MTLGYKILTKQSHQHGLYVEHQISFTLHSLCHDIISVQKLAPTIITRGMITPKIKCIP